EGLRGGRRIERPRDEPRGLRPVESHADRKTGCGEREYAHRQHGEFAHRISFLQLGRTTGRSRPDVNLCGAARKARVNRMPALRLDKGPVPGHDRTSGSGRSLSATRDAAAILTFVIADVRGYTRFTQEHGDEAGARLAAAFAELSREGVEAHGGRVIELRGD